MRKLDHNVWKSIESNNVILDNKMSRIKSKHIHGYW